MAFAKKVNDVPQIPKTEVESVTTSGPSDGGSPSVYISHKVRDFDSEARGKTRCALYQAALQSPVVAQLCMTVEGLEAALEVVKKAADEGFKYVFPDEGK